MLKGERFKDIESARDQRDTMQRESGIDIAILQHKSLPSNYILEDAGAFEREKDTERFAEYERLE